MEESKIFSEKTPFLKKSINQVTNLTSFPRVHERYWKKKFYVIGELFVRTVFIVKGNFDTFIFIATETLMVSRESFC